jgi:hypothetical protein
MCSLGADAPNGWKTPYVLVLLILGVLLIATFIVWEIKYPYSMIDMNIWKDRDFSLVSFEFYCLELSCLKLSCLKLSCPKLSCPKLFYHTLLMVHQLLFILCMGFIGFPIVNFWIALYFQTQLGFSALMTGVHLLPMIVCGLLANLVASMIQHKVSNKLLVGIGAWAYLVSFILAAVQRFGDSYWAFLFPALCLCVVGADFQFIVANVSRAPADARSLLITADVCSLVDASKQAVNGRLVAPDPGPSSHSGIIWRCYCRLRTGTEESIAVRILW